jgi:hypothetical protein
MNGIKLRRKSLEFSNLQWRAIVRLPKLPWQADRPEVSISGLGPAVSDCLCLDYPRRKSGIPAAGSCQYCV